MNISVKQKLTHRHKVRQTCGCQEGGGCGEAKDWEFGIRRCKLLSIGGINILLYSTGNYILYPVINYSGREYEKEYTYICITESLHCMAEINTTW